jgi:hypothetical protein
MDPIKNPVVPTLFGLGGILWFAVFGSALWHAFMCGVPQKFQAGMPPQALFQNQCPMTRPELVKVVQHKLTPRPVLPNGTPLTKVQTKTLHMALSVGKQSGIGGKRLAAVVFQESSLGEATSSPAHYGVGSVGYSALQIVLQRHTWLRPYFQNKNWAVELRRDPKVALWVTAYFLRHCLNVAHDSWSAALSIYRYGHIIPAAPYPQRVKHLQYLVQTLTQHEIEDQS